WGGSRVHLLDRVTGTDLDAGQAGGAALVDNVGATGRGDQCPFGARDQAGTTSGAVGVDGHGHGRYPRGVTTRPSTTRVVDAPTRTHVVMPAPAGSSSASVVTCTCSSERVASVTTATGVDGARCSRRIWRAASSCHVRRSERGL